MQIGNIALLLSVPDILSALTVMAKWVKSGSFAGSTKEKSWTLFQKNVSKITIPGLSLHHTRFLCVQVFQNLLKQKWPPKRIVYENLSHNRKCDQKDFEVLAYIGGALIRKLKYHYIRTKKEDKRVILEMLATEHDNPAVLYSNLIRMRNRGGLTYLKQSTVEFFAEVEGLFRETFRDATSFSRKQFINDAFALAGNDFLFCIQESGDSGQYSDETKHEVMCDLLNKFFKLRVCHRARIIMEKVKVQNLKTKSLRKSLKGDKSK